MNVGNVVQNSLNRLYTKKILDKVVTRMGLWITWKAALVLIALRPWKADAGTSPRQRGVRLSTGDRKRNGRIRTQDFNA